jgi:hypothetical protein
MAETDHDYLLNIDDSGPFIPKYTKETHEKSIGEFNKYFLKILATCDKGISTVDKLKSTLLDYCNFILNLFNKDLIGNIKDVYNDTIPTITIGSNKYCPYLGNMSTIEVSCKTNDPQYEEKKNNVSLLLRKMLINIISKTDTTLLENTNPYLYDLQNTIALYSSFMGHMTLKGLYANYNKPLFDSLNTIFKSHIGKDIIYVKCLNPPQANPIANRDGSGLGCSRLYTIQTRRGMNSSQANYTAIISYSTDSGIGQGSEIRPRNMNNIEGGNRKSRKLKKRRRKTFKLTR